MHDGIQKFCKELNGVFVRSLSSSSLPVNISWSLTEIEGGSLNENKLVRHIICTIIEIKPSKKNAYNEVPKMLQSLAANNPELNVLIPSNLPP